MSKKIRFIEGQMVEYEILPLISQYDPMLRQPTQPINFDAPQINIPYLSLSLMESLKHYQGLGLSANQVGLPLRACAVDMIEENKILCLINPVIVEKAEKPSRYKEGCLSFPGLFLEIGRPEWVTVEFNAGNGEKMTKKFEGIYATCVQHELDHLDGICYTDLVSPIKLDIAKRKVQANLRKIRRATTGA
jgi:peptide deformylase